MKKWIFRLIKNKIKMRLINKITSTPIFDKGSYLEHTPKPNYYN